MNDLEALFDSVDGFKEDLLDFGVAGLSAVGANIAFGWADQKFLGSLPMAVRAGSAIVLGVLGGSWVGKMNRNVGTGIAVGLSATGVKMLISEYMPAFAQQVSLKGLSNQEYRMLAPGVSGAPVQVETQRRALAGATVSIEQRPRNLAGLAATFA